MESAEKYGWQKKQRKKRVVDDTHKRGEIFFCRQFRYNSQSYTSQVLKTLKRVAQNRHLGIQKMGWFLVDLLVHQVILKIKD